MGERSSDWVIAGDSRKSCNKQDRRNCEDKENKPKVRSQGRISIYEDEPRRLDLGLERSCNRSADFVDMSVQTDTVNCTCILESPASVQQDNLKSLQHAEAGSASPQHDRIRSTVLQPAEPECASSAQQKCSQEELIRTSKLLTQEEVPEEYWQEIVEKRRDALNDSLKENEMLREHIVTLQADIAQVSELAEQEDYFKNMIRVLTDEPDFGDDDDIEIELTDNVGVADTVSERVTDHISVVDFDSVDAVSAVSETMTKRTDSFS